MWCVCQKYRSGTGKSGFVHRFSPSISQANPQTYTLVIHCILNFSSFRKLFLALQLQCCMRVMEERKFFCCRRVRRKNCLSRIRDWILLRFFRETRKGPLWSWRWRTEGSSTKVASSVRAVDLAERRMKCQRILWHFMNQKKLTDVGLRKSHIMKK